MNIGTVSLGTEKGLHSKWGDGRLHNFIGGEAGIPLKIKKTLPLAIGAKVDYNYLYDCNKDDGFSGVSGTEQLDWEVNAVITKYSPILQPVPGRIEATPKLKAKVGSEFYGLDFGAGVKVILGIDLNMKIGVKLSDKTSPVIQ